MQLSCKLHIHVIYAFYRRERDKASFSFHVDNEWAGGIRVNKDGVGLFKLWRQQLQQFRNVSPEIASAIIAVYPSPRLLLKVRRLTMSKVIHGN